jgi:tripartite-type tricarboxylate transporter receptor subunit TctC
MLKHRTGAGYACCLLLVQVLLLLWPLASSQAQGSLSTRPIHLIVGFAAGGPTDIVARVVGAKLGEILGQQVVVENRTGASGNLASEVVAHAAPDGLTFLLAPLAFAANENLFPNRHFEYAKDFAAVAPLAETSNVLLVNPSLGVKTVADLIALGKTLPGGILYASAGKGTATHLAGELFGMMAGVKMAAVHYRGGGELVKDLLSGEIKVTFSTIPPVLDFIQKGALRGIATTGAKRDPTLPDLPTIAEALPGYDVRLWLGLLAPASTPRDLVDRISSACAEALAAESVRSVLAAQGFSPLVGTPEQFDAFVRAEIVKWGGVIKVIGTMDN